MDSKWEAVRMFLLGGAQTQMSFDVFVNGGQIQYPAVNLNFNHANVCISLPSSFHALILFYLFFLFFLLLFPFPPYLLTLLFTIMKGFNTYGFTYSSSGIAFYANGDLLASIPTAPSSSLGILTIYIPTYVDNLQIIFDDVISGASDV